MARIRSIHPGLFTDESYMGASVYARLLLPGIWCEAWDDGVIEWRPLRLKARIFPVDAVNVEEILIELEGLDVIRRFECDGRTYAAIRNFRKWQNPKAPNSSNVLPSSLRNYVGLPDDVPSNSENDPHYPHEIPQNSVSVSACLENDFRNASEKSRQKGGREEGRKEKKDSLLVDLPSAEDAQPPPAAPAAPALEREQADADPGGGDAPDPSSHADKRRAAVALEADFRAFYAAYPRKQAPDRAKAAYLRARRAGAVHDAIMRALQAAMRTDKRFLGEREFIPHPASWLNGGDWKTLELPDTPRPAQFRDPFDGWETADHLALARWRRERDTGTWLTRDAAYNARTTPEQRREALIAHIRETAPRVAAYLNNGGA